MEALLDEMATVMFVACGDAALKSLGVAIDKLSAETADTTV